MVDIPMDDNAPATKGDIKRLEQNIDGLDQKIQGQMQGMDQKIQGLDQNVSSLARQVIDIRENMVTKNEFNVLQGDVRRMTQSVDSFLGKLERNERETVTIPTRLDAHGAQLQNHETRITRIESQR